MHWLTVRWLTRMCLQARFLDLHRVMSIKDFLSGWFRGAPYEAVRRGNVEDFVAYGFYTRAMSQLPDKARQSCKHDVEASMAR